MAALWLLRMAFEREEQDMGSEEHVISLTAWGAPISPLHY